MTAFAWLLDIFLALGLLWFGWEALFGRTLFKSVVMMIAFGLLMAVTWARLGAVDIALAEATIGAGVAGALLLDAVGHIGEHRASRTKRRSRGSKSPETISGT